MLSDPELSLDGAAPAPPRRLSNISFPPHGTVEGSEKNAQKEEMFLCNRLADETSAGNEFKRTHWISWNSRVSSVIQGVKRPVCGLVALCMAGHMLKRHDPLITTYANDEALLKVARNLGYTKQGEMFSAKQYAHLAQKVFNCETEVLHDTLLNSVRRIIQHLTNGYPVLVPYDTDRNYEPCLRKGHKAHWAILTGFVIGHQAKLSKGKEVDSPVTHIANAVDLSEIFQNITLNPTLVYVYAKQGKSARQQLWMLKSLSASNANLKGVSPERDTDLYMIPEEGISKTLCSQSVLVFPKKSV